MYREGSDSVSTIPFHGGQGPVPPAEIRIESLGLHALDRRRVDVAVDLTPCQQPVDVEMVIVGPGGDELCCIRLVRNSEWMLDKIMHLRQDAQPGEHTLHVGVFYGEKLMAQAARAFTFLLAGSG